MVRKSDEELVLAWKGGDRSASEELFRRHFRSLQGFFRAKVEPSAQDDILQETLMGCVSSIARFRGDASFRTFLFRVAWNKLNDYLRRKVRQPEMVDLDEISVADINPGFSTVQARRREQALLLEALHTIPLKHQIVLELKYCERLTDPQIAAVLECPVSTVASRLHRAKERLRQRLERMRATPSEITTVLDGLESWALEIRDLLGRPDPDAAPVTSPSVSAPG